MKISLNKNHLLEKLSLSSKFTSSKLSSLASLQGVCLKSEKGRLHFYSSNLNSYFHTTIKTEIEKEETIVVEARRIIEFLSFLPEGKIEIETRNKNISMSTGKTNGKFPLLDAGDFPLPPKISEKEQKIEPSFLFKKLPLVLFAASIDETRPALSGVNFLTNNELVIVTTDGFRLSLIKTKKEKDLPSIIIPADFLKEVINIIKEEKEIKFYHSDKEKIILFKAGEEEFYSRLVEGEFPPFEKVIPQNKTTTIILEKEEFQRNIKLISIFARDASNIMVIDVGKGEINLRPKTDDEEGNKTKQEAETKGEKTKVAFNYKYVLDFLNNIDSKKIIIEILRPDAPVVFRTQENKEFLHIIMPVRIQE